MRHGTTSNVTFITITEKSVILKLKLIKILPEIGVQKFNPIEILENESNFIKVVYDTLG